MKTIRFLSAATVFAAFGSAHAGLLYTVDVVNHELQTFNTQTLAFTNVAAMDTGFDFGNLAYDGASHTMYMSQGFAGTGLYSLNVTTGHGTLIGDTGTNSVFGLADVNGQLYGGRSSGGTGFYSINKTTGAGTFLGDPGHSLDALAYLSGSDLLLGAEAGPGNLYVLDRNNGQVLTTLSAGPFFDNCGMTYDPDTKKVWMIDWSGNVITFDPFNNWARAQVLSGVGAHDGLQGTTTVPEPTTILALGLGAVALLRRRTKK